MEKTQPTTQWYSDSVVYHIYPRTFCDALGTGFGNVEGILSKLDYLSDLGVNTLYVEDIDGCLAADEDLSVVLKPLLEGLVSRDMHLLLDLPFAYTTTDHPWFADSVKGMHPYVDYYLWREGKGKRPPDGRKVHGKSVWALADNGKWYMHSDGKPLLNWDCAEMRRDVAMLAQMRLSLGIDGFVLNAKDVRLESALEHKRIAAEASTIYAYLRDFAASLRA